jgi:ABC-type phosphate/phosphonate transport system substrate-binding protein
MKMKKLLIISICTLFLASCGGNDDVSAEAEAAPVEAKKANNPLASQQQLIRDAEAIQGILDKDADEKKKAVDETN